MKCLHRQNLRSLGHIASTFGSAEDFLKSGKMLDTSCLITDVQMPGLNGTDLQDRLIAEGHPFPSFLSRLILTRTFGHARSRLVRLASWSSQSILTT